MRHILKSEYELSYKAWPTREIGEADGTWVLTRWRSELAWGSLGECYREYKLYIQAEKATAQWAKEERRSVI
jgi:hypothetical protein